MICSVPDAALMEMWTFFRRAVFDAVDKIVFAYFRLDCCCFFDVLWDCKGGQELS
jgi:hypothetical protein